MAGIQLHPASVHFPITFIALTGFLDLLYSASSFPPTGSFILSTLKYLDVPSALVELLPQLSFYTTILALVTTIPAIVTGFSDLLPLILRDGFGTPKVRTGLLHAGLNDVATAMMAFNWWTRRHVEDLAPTAVNTMLSGLLAMPVMFYAASLGGHLVYGYGMGVGKSSNKQKKSQ
ncbi:hypothetical protein LSUB1_G001097 [Lachnellula subtilissima]|uniref:DUF2231 domain-containing protein n=1 Tax=Lachnellula subtilissima TaxID=602034 RepID=A0A8H8UEG4_9HELO|nr:hypothetical protein LSUB1_G001097 [Lachnellula subtilissima]